MALNIEPNAIDDVYTTPSGMQTGEHPYLTRTLRSSGLSEQENEIRDNVIAGDCGLSRMSYA